MDSENATSSGVNIGEGTTAPSNVNNWGRRIMSQLRAAFNPVLDTFFASTTLAQARTALGVSEGTASSNAFNALTNAANKLPYMTGSDGWATTDLTSFVRTLLATGSGGAFMALLFTPSSISATSGYITIPIGSDNLKLQWKDATIGAGSASTVTYPSAYTSWSRAWCSGGVQVDGDEDNNFPSVLSTTTTGASIYNAYGQSVPTTVFSIGV